MGLSSYSLIRLRGRGTASAVGGAFFAFRRRICTSRRLFVIPPCSRWRLTRYFPPFTIAFFIFGILMFVVVLRYSYFMQTAGVHQTSVVALANIVFLKDICVWLLYRKITLLSSVILKFYLFFYAPVIFASCDKITKKTLKPRINP